MRKVTVKLYLLFMVFRRKYLLTALLFVLCVALHLYSRDSFRVEAGYSRGLFPMLGAAQRLLFGWLPFSLGDLLYGAILIYAIFRLIKGARNTPRKWKSLMLTVVNFCMIIYLLFNLLWGLNYNRKGVLSAMQIKEVVYSKNELAELNEILLNNVNSAKKRWITEGGKYPVKKLLFDKADEAFSVAAEKYPFLNYRFQSIKPSIWSLPGNYLGFTGYYNPFTGEAQVNTTTPVFLHPFIACHEIAHQVGYAKEMEANFVGFLAAMNSPDPLFQYSAYLDLFFYANRNLFYIDSSAAKNYRAKLILPVKKDIDELRRFQKSHRSFMEPVFKWAYGKFLEQNEQPQGIMAYDEVTSFIIAFYRNEGLITN